jgi:hypothetical protein
VWAGVRRRGERAVGPKGGARGARGEGRRCWGEEVKRAVSEVAKCRADNIAVAGTCS